jgi:hypothetical protein
MATTNPFRLVSAGWRSIVGLALFGAVLATLASFLRPIEYASTVRLLILQTNAGGLDPYTALKSTERIAQNLGVLAYTSSFWSGLSQRVALDAAAVSASTTNGATTPPAKPASRTSRR